MKTNKQNKIKQQQKTRGCKYTTGVKNSRTTLKRGPRPPYVLGLQLSGVIIHRIKYTNRSQNH